MDKYCSKCGAKNFADAKFCEQCGAPFAVSQTQTQMQQTVVAKTSGKAVASFVLSILWLFWIGSIIAIIFGHIARAEIKNSGGRLKGAGLALAGLIIGYFMLALLPLGIFSAVALPKFVSVRDDAQIAKAHSDILTLRGAIITNYVKTGSFIPADQLSVESIFDGVGLDIEPSLADGHWTQDSSDPAVYYFRINGKDCSFRYNEYDGSFELESEYKICQKLDTRMSRADEYK